jgi:hypothetical protein
LVRLPREISPGAASRRAFFADLLAALALAIVAIALAAGIGVVGLLALLVLLALSAWVGVEAVVRSLRRRRQPGRLRSSSIFKES